MTAAAAEGHTPAAQAYYSTSYSFGNGTTSTVGLVIWRALSEHLEQHGLPLTGEELAGIAGITPDEIDQIFGQQYYQKFYGFRRFDTLEAWRAWATEVGVLYNPALHDRPEEEAIEVLDGSDSIEVVDGPEATKE